jgi:hypothetical protein
MRRFLVPLLLCVALLFQAAGPALAALSTDCLCVESACHADASLPCADSGIGCANGPCARNPAALAPAQHPDPAPRQSWAAQLPPPLTAHPPDSDLRPPIG